MDTNPWFPLTYYYYNYYHVIRNDDYYDPIIAVCCCFSVVNPVWIGLKYEPLDQTFRWRDGTKTLRNNWYKTSSISEPDNLSTEQCVSIFKGWDNYASILTKECTKNYHILCGSYGMYNKYNFLQLCSKCHIILICIRKLFDHRNI